MAKLFVRTVGLFLLLISPPLYSKVLIITHNFNAPTFVGLQKRTFDRFVQDEYEYVVFNDANNEPMARQIQAACDEYGVHCIRVPQQIHTRPYLPRQPRDPLQRPNIRHANCVQYSMDRLGFDFDGIVMLIDSDMLLIRPLNFEKHMADKHIVAFLKGAGPNVAYICPALAIFNMPHLPEPHTMNFNCGMADGASVDSGGWTHYYLKKYRSQLKLFGVSYLPSYDLWLGNHDINRPVDHSVSDHVKIAKYEQLGFNEKEIRFMLKKPDTFEFFFDKNLVHYHGASNYSNQPASYHARKLAIFKELVDDLTLD